MACKGSCKIHTAHITDLSFILIRGADDPPPSGFEHIRHAIGLALGEYGWHDPKCVGKKCFCQENKGQHPKPVKETLTSQRIVIYLAGKPVEILVSCKRSVKTYEGTCIDD